MKVFICDIEKYTNNLEPQFLKNSALRTSMEVTVNFWAVLAAAIASMIIGWAWYSPALFGNAWLRSMNKRADEINKDDARRAMSFMFIAPLVTAYVLSHFANYVGAITVSTGAQLGFWVWLGFIATFTLTGILFENKSRLWYFITNGYQLISLVVMSIIIAIWR